MKAKVHFLPEITNLSLKSILPECKKQLPEKVMRQLCSKPLIPEGNLPSKKKIRKRILLINITHIDSFIALSLHCKNTIIDMVNIHFIKHSII